MMTSITSLLNDLLKNSAQITCNQSLNTIFFEQVEYPLASSDELSYFDEDASFFTQQNNLEN